MTKFSFKPSHLNNTEQQERQEQISATANENEDLFFKLSLAQWFLHQP